eukprot:Hpha_TRINITY_DN13915_c0_g2::TRINITY_DN13915_c0_g2_i1::g.35873::m.35873
MFGLIPLREAGCEVGDLIEWFITRIRSTAKLHSDFALRQAMLLAGVKLKDLAPSTARQRLYGSAGERVLFYILQQGGVTGVQFNYRHRSGFEFDMFVGGKIVVELIGDGAKYSSSGWHRKNAVLVRYLEHEHGLLHRSVVCDYNLSRTVRELRNICEAASGAPKKAWDTAEAYASRMWNSNVHTMNHTSPTFGRF